MKKKNWKNKPVKNPLTIFNHQFNDVSVGVKKFKKIPKYNKNAEKPQVKNFNQQLPQISVAAKKSKVAPKHKNKAGKNFPKNFNKKFVKITRVVKKFKVSPKYGKFFWKFSQSPFLKNNQKNLFLIGSDSEKMNPIYNSQILLSKNNIALFNPIKLRRQLFRVYAAFRWIKAARMSAFFYKSHKMMFASTTPTFAGLMNWAGNVANGLSSGNRWLGGTISGQINAEYRPNFVFIPDMDQNLMIIKEARKRKVAIVSVVATDTCYYADFPIFGNNKSFKNIATIVSFLITVTKHKEFFAERPADELVGSQKWFNALALKKVF